MTVAEVAARLGIGDLESALDPPRACPTEWHGAWPKTAQRDGRQVFDFSRAHVGIGLAEGFPGNVQPWSKLMRTVFHRALLFSLLIVAIGCSASPEAELAPLAAQD